jgi:hypothetical protein
MSFKKSLIFLSICICFININLKSQSLAGAIKPAIKEGGFKMEGYMLWCPSVIKVGKTYHLFASRWPDQYGLAGWINYSEIVRATSDNLYGPYTFQEVVIQKREDNWDKARAHNPRIIKAGDKFVLYYISSANSTGYAWANDIAGPWNRIDAPAMNFSNPAPLAKKDGSIYVFGRKGIVKTYNVAQAFSAPSFDGKYTILNQKENLLPDSNQIEDPTIWWANNQYNIVLSDFKGNLTGTKKNGAQYYSVDGLNYLPVSKESIYTKTVNYSDGSSYTFRRRERPFIYSNEKEEVLALFTSCLTPEDKSWIVVNPVNNYLPPKVK